MASGWRIILREAPPNQTDGAENPTVRPRERLRSWIEILKQRRSRSSKRCSSFRPKRPNEVGRGNLGPHGYNSYADGHRLYFRVSKDFFDEDDIGPVEAELREVFDSTVHQISASWGEPLFHAREIAVDDMDAAEEGPLHERLYASGALALAIWRRGDFLAYLEVEHQDRALPMMLILGTEGAVPKDDIYGT